MKRAADFDAQTVENDTSTLDGALQACCKAIKEGRDSADELGAVVERFGLEALRNWRFQAGKHRNSLLHSLVAQKLGSAVEYLVRTHNFDINLPRESDLCTPLHLSIWTKQPSLSALLLDLGADPLRVNAYGEDCTTMLKTVDEWRAKCQNLVWLDFELDSLPMDALAAGTKPRVLECCVIITNNDLEVLEEKEWIVAISEEEAKAMSPWHQKTFASKEKGGNGLFEACLASQLSAETLEREMLELLQRHCCEKTNLLAGNSVHVDQQVLLLSLPSIARFLSHRVLDVSVLNTIASRWYPEMLKGLESCYDTYHHRARGDVLSSMAQLKFYRAGLLNKDAVMVEKEESKCPEAARPISIHLESQTAKESQS